MDPADRVASTKANADDIKTWSVSEVDKKGKKKKGTLGVGNGAVFFASESDKVCCMYLLSPSKISRMHARQTPVQKWQTLHIENINIEKSKHVHIDVGGPTPINLHFNAGSKDTADAIVTKLQSSKALSQPSPSTSPQPNNRASSESESRSPESTNSKTKKVASVHFSPSSPAIIPPREPSEDGSEEEPDAVETNGHITDPDLESATVLYDFTADGEDELSVVQGEHLVILEKDGDEWWKCRNSQGAVGVVPASYIDVSDSTSSFGLPKLIRKSASQVAPTAPTSSVGNGRVVEPESEEDEDDNSAALEAERQAEAERLERAEKEKERIRAEKEKQRKKFEAQQRAKASAAAAEANLKQ